MSIVSGGTVITADKLVERLGDELQSAWVELVETRHLLAMVLETIDRRQDTSLAAEVYEIPKLLAWWDGFNAEEVRRRAEALAAVKAKLTPLELKLLNL